MTKTSLNDIIKGIKRRKLLVASFPIFARFSKLVISGVPDAIVFLKSSPAYIIELKTTKGETARLWKDQLVQVRVYGLVLEEMGFDCSKLKLVVIRIRRQDDLSAQYKQNLLRTSITDLLKGGQKTAASKAESTTHIIDYDKQDVIADLRWAEAYWLLQREPIPTLNIAKCRNCEFNDMCPRSLIRAYGQKSLQSFSDRN
jgi:CRISPR/Cas system-associated exonuclease Cas4 (RecB family)